MKWTRALSRLVLFVGCGSFLTLLSGLYIREPSPMFLDVVPTDYRGLQFGYPFPIFSSYVELWSGGQLYSDVLFVWVGALLDIVFYAFIVGIVFFSLDWFRIARTSRVPKSQAVQ